MPRRNAYADAIVSAPHVSFKKNSATTLPPYTRHSARRSDGRVAFGVPLFALAARFAFNSARSAATSCSHTLASWGVFVAGEKKAFFFSKKKNL
jgi:hypothetical protein